MGFTFTWSCWPVKTLAVGPGGGLNRDSPSFGDSFAEESKYITGGEEYVSSLSKYTKSSMLSTEYSPKTFHPWIPRCPGNSVIMS